MIAVLDNIRSVHNVGSVFRTADGAGFEKIYLCGVTPLPTDRFGKLRNDFAKTALGAEKKVQWEHVSSTVRILNSLKKKGWYIVALEQAKGSVSYRKAKISKKQKEKTALVVGNEVEGIPKSVLKYADMVIEIPMRGTKESLNVSVSFGIAAYTLVDN
jgi:tRNA G18 (ribose-2'-O)-methylase SpoU